MLFLSGLITSLFLLKTFDDFAHMNEHNFLSPQVLLYVKIIGSILAIVIIVQCIEDGFIKEKIWVSSTVHGAAGELEGAWAWWGGISGIWCGLLLLYVFDLYPPLTCFLEPFALAPFKLREYMLRLIGFS